MSCTNYWNTCTQCKNETYDRNIKHVCETCNGTCDHIIEHDEDFAEQDCEEKSSKFNFGDEDC